MYFSTWETRRGSRNIWRKWGQNQTHTWSSLATKATPFACLLTVGKAISVTSSLAATGVLGTRNIRKISREWPYSVALAAFAWKCRFAMRYQSLGPSMPWQLTFAPGNSRSRSNGVQSKDYARLTGKAPE